MDYTQNLVCLRISTISYKLIAKLPVLYLGFLKIVLIKWLCIMKVITQGSVRAYHTVDVPNFLLLLN